MRHERSRKRLPMPVAVLALLCLYATQLSGADAQGLTLEVDSIKGSRMTQLTTYRSVSIQGVSIFYREAGQLPTQETVDICAETALRDSGSRNERPILSNNGTHPPRVALCDGAGWTPTGMVGLPGWQGRDHAAHKVGSRSPKRQKT